MLKQILAAVLIIGAAAPAEAQDSPDGAALAAARDRGALIHAYDQAAWHGTDDLLAKIKAPEGKIGGWIVDGPVTGPEIVFYDQAAEPSAIYVARFRGNRLVTSRLVASSEDGVLTPQRRAMIAAGKAAGDALVKSKPLVCSDRPFNRVILPPAAPGAPTLVYFLTPRTANDTIPMGGHHLVEVAADGRAGKPRGFTKGCMALPLKPPADRAGATPAALVVSHLLDPTPTEIHVFSALAIGKPLYVMTGEHALWAVAGTRIRKVEQPK